MLGVPTSHMGVAILGCTSLHNAQKRGWTPIALGSIAKKVQCPLLFHLRGPLGSHKMRKGWEQTFLTIRPILAKGFIFLPLLYTDKTKPGKVTHPLCAHLIRVVCLGWPGHVIRPSLCAHTSFLHVQMSQVVHTRSCTTA